MAGPAPTTRTLGWRLAQGAATLGLALAFLYFALRGVEWSAVWTLVKGARADFLGIAVALISIATLMRALRWRILLSSGTSKVSVHLAFWATAAGYFGNNVLPARAGELIRTLIVSRTSGMSTVFVLTTALTERVSDAIALIATATFVLLMFPVKRGWFAEAATPFAIAGTCGVVSIALFPVFEHVWRGLLARLPISAGWHNKIGTIVGQVLQALRGFHNFRRLCSFVMLTAVVWSVDALVAMAVAQALGLSMTLPVALLLLTGLGLGSALPSTPGYIGVYQFVAVSVLTPFGYSRTDAIAYIVLLQAVNYAGVLSWGGIGIGLYRKLAMPEQIRA